MSSIFYYTSLWFVIKRILLLQTSLLMALLGQMRAVQGQCITDGSSFSYVAQEPWIFSDTVQNNILFGEHLQPTRYDDVIKACGLQQVIIVDINRY